MNTQFKLMMVIGIGGLLMACQSQPKSTIKTTNSQRATQTSTVTTQVTRREVPVIKSKDGVQDIRWIVTQVKFKKALFFNETPYLVLNSATQRVQAHTGCNPIFGTYQANATVKTLKLDVSAGHASCDNALSQEADLMDAFARTESFQISGKTIQLLDKSRQILITAEQR